MSQTKAQLLDNIKDNVQLDARNSLRFADTDSSHYVAFKAPATVSSNVTWTLPAAEKFTEVLSIPDIIKGLETLRF